MAEINHQEPNFNHPLIQEAMMAAQEAGLEPQKKLEEWQYSTAPKPKQTTPLANPSK